MFSWGQSQIDRLPSVAGVEIPNRAEWPVSLRAGSLVLRPLRRRDEAGWTSVRSQNASWLQPWDATTPTASSDVFSFADMVRYQEQQAKAGLSLPWVMAWDASWPDGTGGLMRSGMAVGSVMAADQTEIVGQVIVSGITYGSAQSARIGYWISQAYSGRALTPLGVALAVDYCFFVLGLHRVEIDIRPENDRSLRVVEKLGFRPEGAKRRSLHINGDWRDHLGFAIDTTDAPRGLVAGLLAGRGVPGA